MYVIKRTLKDYSRPGKQYFNEGKVYHKLLCRDITLCGLNVDGLDLWKRVRPKDRRMCDRCMRI